MDVRFDVSGFDEHDARLAKLISTLGDLRPFWPLLVPLFVRWMRDQFESQGRWGGDPWEPLAPSSVTARTQAQLRHPTVYVNRGILWATGDLRKSASQPRRQATPSTLTLIIDDSEYTHGAATPRSVAGYHQFGTDKMAARPLIPEVLPDRAEAEVHEAADRWVDEMAHRIGLR